jgi:hypothetical protein
LEPLDDFATDLTFVRDVAGGGDEDADGFHLIKYQ